MLLDDPGRVRSQNTSVVCQIQLFDFDCNLVVTRKVIIRTCAPLRLKPLYALRSANSLKIGKSEKNLKITAVYTRVLEYLVYISPAATARL